ncbi:hypothetical protein KIL84_020695 [Mauremys mutica]|uniref:Uncharacterized protein n=1 Tax=Mauremys mutica TaxID=74926 RepID=A0A9D3XAF3_9SAUR|nr:hypothetical protein KIL84_020695 [Mauremys mutica]
MLYYQAALAVGLQVAGGLAFCISSAWPVFYRLYKGSSGSQPGAEVTRLSMQVRRIVTSPSDGFSGVGIGPLSSGMVAMRLGPWVTMVLSCLPLPLTGTYSSSLDGRKMPVRKSLCMRRLGPVLFRPTHELQSQEDTRDI